MYIPNFNSHAHVERDKFFTSADTSLKHFNSHAHVERDQLIKIYFVYYINFNSHAHVERDYCYHRNTIVIIIFQLTRSRGAWRQNLLLLIQFWDFNSHAHVERDDKTTLKGVKGKDFNSHAHVERDFGSGAKEHTLFISTHTLTWSVTLKHALLIISLLFQLTRSRGAWQRIIFLKINYVIFQLTRSRGAWL